MNTGLQLRDIHMPAEPGWWPPTVTTFIVLLMGVVLLAAGMAWLWRHLARHRRARALASYFDGHIASAASEDERLQRASACLRRVVARRHPEAVAKAGAAWLAVLDGDDPGQPFSAGPGRLLADGPFRGGFKPGEAQAAIELARARFLQWGGSVDA
jgi:hypothetical protein